MSVQLADGISEESYAAIKENSDELLGMEVSVESHRVYNDSVYFAQIIGYIGNISNEELENIMKLWMIQKNTVQMIWSVNGT